MTTAADCGVDVVLVAQPDSSIARAETAQVKSTALVWDLIMGVAASCDDLGIWGGFVEGRCEVSLANLCGCSGCPSNEVEFHHQPAVVAGRAWSANKGGDVENTFPEGRHLLTPGPQSLR